MRKQALVTAANLEGQTKRISITRETPRRCCLQEERTIEEIANSGDRDFLEFSAYDLGGHTAYPYQNLKGH